MNKIHRPIILRKWLEISIKKGSTKIRDLFCPLTIKELCSILWPFWDCKSNCRRLPTSFYLKVLQAFSQRWDIENWPEKMASTSLGFLFWSFRKIYVLFSVVISQFFQQKTKNFKYIWFVQCTYLKYDEAFV